MCDRRGLLLQMPMDIVGRLTMLFLLLVLLIFATEKMQSPRSHITEELRDHGWTSLEEGKLVLRQGRWIAGDKARGTMFAFDKFSLLLCLLGGIHQVLGDDVDILWATATKWDLRDNTDSGCGPVGGEGCEAMNTIDGELNDVPDSRWSCHDEDIGEEISSCSITWELPSLHSLDNITIYFYKSDDAERHSNGFNLSTSADGTTFTDVADGLASIIPTPLGEGNTYDLSASTSAVKVRMTGTDSDQEWLSVCEAQICGIPVTPAPTPVTTSAPTADGAARGSVLTPAPAFSESTATPAASPASPASPTASPGSPSAVETLVPTSPGGIASSPTNNGGGGEGDGGDDGDDGGDGQTRTAIIIGCVCGGVALLVLVGLGVGYHRVRKSRSRAPAPPPPSYEVVVGTGTQASGAPGKGSHV